MSAKNKIGYCEACHRYCDGKERYVNGSKKPIPDVLTKHHIYPKRYYGIRTNWQTIDLCHQCHSKLEKVILAHEKKMLGIYGQPSMKALLLNFPYDCMRENFRQIANEFCSSQLARSPFS